MPFTANDRMRFVWDVNGRIGLPYRTNRYPVNCNTVTVTCLLPRERKVNNMQLCTVSKTGDQLSADLVVENEFW